MTLTRSLTTALLALSLVFSACGGTETDVADEPVDISDTTEPNESNESTDDAARAGTGTGTRITRCSYPTFTCYDANGRVTGVSDGCSITCYNQTAMCWPGTCNGRITIDAACSCWAF